ncbi:YopJ family acetyltransferase [Methylibium rhizosphaerae]|uniref:YopJ family acetyltransferase n=1 Tax=Methylibium rhizosphaerae TaxID=2570323 RepID=UPI00112924A9|nr:YopJ family acetyltransferase [Methylibium rhizosphaerae]
MAPRYPKAIAKARDPSLGPVFDRELAAQRQPGLMNYLLELEAAYLENRTPVVKDAEHLDALIAGLNRAEPGLHLERNDVMKFELQDAIDDYPLVRRLAEGLGTSAAWRMIINNDDDTDHRSALSVKCNPSSRDASLILVESLGDKEQVMDLWQDLLPRVTDALRRRLPGDPPVRLHLAVANTTAQRTPEGCDIFALAAARKMASEPQIARLHDAILAKPPADASGSHITPLPATLLPASLLKHSTSGTALLDSLFQRDASPHAQKQDGVFNPVVNRDGQTLLERWTSHLTHRWDAKAEKPRTYSNSYEAKRIDLVRTALAHLVKDGPS